MASAASYKCSIGRLASFFTNACATRTAMLSDGLTFQILRAGTGKEEVVIGEAPARKQGNPRSLDRPGIRPAAAERLADALRLG